MDDPRKLVKRLRESRASWEDARGVPTDLEAEAADALTAALDEIVTLRTEKHADAEAIGTLLEALEAIRDTSMMARGEQGNRDTCKHNFRIAHQSIRSLKKGADQ